MARYRQARRIIATMRGSAPTSELPSLQDFIAASPGLDAPAHLTPITDIFEAIASGTERRDLVSTPPQHGKSMAALHALVWLLKGNPRKRHAYVTYAQQFSRDQSWLAQRIAETQGLRLYRDTQDRWVTPAGGGVTWTSRGGGLTGKPVDGVLLVDDILKDREEANSQLIRQKAMGWLSSVAFTRMHPGASFVMIATRWHLDDPVGQLSVSDGYKVHNLPAIDADGRALWPEHRPIEWLEAQRERLLPSDWSALYMGQPRADGDRVFGPSVYYDALPVDDRGEPLPYREEHGFDAAYTTKTTSDYSVTITGRLIAGRMYITNMLRRRAEMGQYIPLMHGMGATRIHWMASSTEKGLALLLEREGIRVELLPTTTDKLSRAIPAATAWNRGEILIPRAAPWTPALEAELSTFTGISDAHDDIVDALAALHHALCVTSIADVSRLRRAGGL